MRYFIYKNASTALPARRKKASVASQALTRALPADEPVGLLNPIPFKETDWLASISGQDIRGILRPVVAECGVLWRPMGLV